MTKQEFVDQVASKAGLGKSEAGKAVDSVLDVIQETLSRGGEVAFTGFGKFTVAQRGARQGVNPQTGEYRLVLQGTLGRDEKPEQY